MTTVFTNGCFDVIHRAHIDLLEFCFNEGTSVIVGLNSDSSIKKLKGDSRPINCQGDRKKVLESIKFVDDVIIFEEEDPYKLIKRLKPDIIVKGGDYTAEQVIGNDICKVVIFNFIDGYSTTRTIQNIADR